MIINFSRGVEGIVPKSDRLYSRIDTAVENSHGATYEHKRQSRYFEIVFSSLIRRA